MLLRAVWFLLIGWWLGAIWAALAYLFCLSIIGLPIGVLMLNRLPQVLTLKPAETEPIHTMRDGKPAVVEAPAEEYPFILRALWFFVLGWEIAGLALVIGYLLCLTILGIPAGLWILNRVPLVMTLKRA